MSRKSSEYYVFSSQNSSFNSKYRIHKHIENFKQNFTEELFKLEL